MRNGYWMEEILIKAENLHYTYEDGTRALRGVDLEIHRGKKIALMGANGSGKSTFFLCLNGILKPVKGRLVYQGKPYGYKRKELLELRSRVGIVFQNPDNQLFSADIYQEISFGPLNLGIPEEEIRARVKQVMEELKITEFSQKPTHALSGGQKKQVSIADIVVMRPELIILDEPAAALDPKHSALLNGIIDSLTAKGITVMISTHDVDFAYSWADEAVLFYEGQVLIQGPPQNVFNNRTALEKTHLVQPAVLKMFESLCKKDLLRPGLPVPRTMKELEGYIEAVREPVYFGRKNDMDREKKAILAVSFGTTHTDTREKTIDVIEKDMARRFPGYRIYHAWTSKMVLKRLRERDQVIIPTVTEAVRQMVKDGITHLTVQPTHIINGIENDRMKEDVLAFREQFSAISFGTPLLTAEEDNAKVIRAVMREFPDLGRDEALVFMGHGTAHYANAVYAALDYTFKDMGYENVFMGTVEAYPSMETILKLVREYGPAKVILAPFMIVAGDHARNDMASDDEKSWRCQFGAAGFKVECVMRGLGEYEGIREILMEHVKEALV